MKRAKLLFLALAVSALFTGCGAVAINARACKTLPDGSKLCAATDGKSITLELSSK